MEVRALSGDEIESIIPAIGRLRIAVFRDWPYLYEGTAAYERDYLRAFASAPDAVLVGAFDGDRIVGAATASPLSAQDEAIRAPFEARDMSTDSVFYFGESVLLPEYRGRGVGHRFFDLREAGARTAGASRAAFASVLRPTDHALRPGGYAPLDPFWRKRGYAPVEGLLCALAWQDVGQADETPHHLQFWMRELDA